MSKGIDTEEVIEDLMFFNDIAEMYTYGTDEDGDVVLIEHYDEEGQVSGYQTVTIAVSDFKDIAEGMSAASMQVFMDQAQAIGQSLAEEDRTPVMPSTTLRDTASYLAALNVKLRPEDLAYVCDFLNVYADQLEGSE